VITGDLAVADEDGWLTIGKDPQADDPEEPLRVYADPAGHPFCIFVG
jgi:hypothetical protein